MYSGVLLCPLKITGYLHKCSRLPWQFGFTPTILRRMGGAMVQIINQTGSANPVVPKFLGSIRGEL